MALSADDVLNIKILAALSKLDEGQKFAAFELFEREWPEYADQAEKLLNLMQERDTVLEEAGRAE
ncbi:hypothetical protein GCM10011491_05510 [Brucella endophytica]|uniref:Uncharacterized protein n=1 Tax=Brucella endophytica TaxID=1963359 RepID=A0A916S356_9HYPH|nr:hypothetical protein [Brucella endophytica]GGA81114.1 hypothetical protein GCM10011491_05510 [Brucella endophytica]